MVPAAVRLLACHRMRRGRSQMVAAPVYWKCTSPLPPLCPACSLTDACALNPAAGAVGSGAGGRGGGGGTDLYGLAAAILGGGGPLAALGAPFFMGGGPEYAAPHELLHGGAAGGGGGNRRGAAAPRRAAPPPAIPPRHDFRVEVSSQLSTARCATCGNAIGEHTTRIGMRQAGASRRSSAGYQWHHLACLPAVYYREAAERGVDGLRGVPARDQAFVRERMRPPR